MGKQTYNKNTDKTYMANQLQGFAQMLGLVGVRVTYLLSAGGLYRVDMPDKESHFFTCMTDVTNFIVAKAQEHYFIQGFRDSISKRD